MDRRIGETPSRFASNFILQAITHVRNRKARPDLAEICRQMKRLQNWSEGETKACVKDLMELGIILRVEYKNNFSFRDPADLQKGHVSGTISNSTGLVLKLQSAIDGAIAMNLTEQPDLEHGVSHGRNYCTNPELGATLEEIEEFLNSEQKRRNDVCMLRGNSLKEVMDSEVNRANIVKKQVNNTFRYCVGKRMTVEQPCVEKPAPQTIVADPAETEKVPEMQTDKAEPAPVQEIEPASDRVRRPKRKSADRLQRTQKYTEEMYELPPVKKNRKPSQMFPQGPNSATAVISPNQCNARSAEDVPIVPEFRLANMFRQCIEVHQTENPSRHAGQESEMLKCCGCNMTAHPNCLKYSDRLLSKIDRSIWRCVTCKKCTRCDILLRTPTPLTCSGCDLAYHKACHVPQVRKIKNKERWICMKCTSPSTPVAENSATTTTTLATTCVRALEPTASVGMNGAAEASWEGDQPGQEDGGEIVEGGEDSQHSIPSATASGAVKSTANGKDTAFPPTPRDSPSLEESYKEMYGFRSRQNGDLPSSTQSLRKVSQFDGVNFPDPGCWTMEEVYNYISSLKDNNGVFVFVKAAEALREEGIDGESLMDLSRNDVLTRFKLKVGPALKLFRLIVNMRTSGNAFKYNLGQ